MEYIKVYWMHDFIDEPIILYSELDEKRFEVRKIEIYRNNRIGYATYDISVNDTYLSEFPIPEIIEINVDKQFMASKISKREFEDIWINIIKIEGKFWK